MEKSIDEIISEETQERLKEMGSENYEFPEKIGKVDVFGIIALILICTLLIVLCMMGVIK